MRHFLFGGGGCVTDIFFLCKSVLCFFLVILQNEKHPMVLASFCLSGTERIKFQI